VWSFDLDGELGTGRSLAVAGLAPPGSTTSSASRGDAALLRLTPIDGLSNIRGPGISDEKAREIVDTLVFTVNFYQDEEG